MKDPTDRAGKATRRIVAVVLCVLLAALCFSGGWCARWFTIDGRFRDLMWAVETARDRYYEEVDEDALFEAFFDDLSLDPYTVYYRAEEYGAVRDTAEGNGMDTGLSLSRVETEGKVRIFSVKGNSPAEKAGILRGMFVFRFGGSEETLAEGTMEDLLALAAKTSTLVLECGFDAEGSDARIYSVERAAYHVSECLYRDMGGAFRFVGSDRIEAPIGKLGLPASYAYVRVDTFHGTAASELVSCLELMRERGRSHLVLDLRSNGGGYLNIMLEMAGCLMRDAEGQTPLAAYSKERSGKTTGFYAPYNRFSELFGEDARVIVLADENTASASECLIGALISAGTVSYGDIYVREQADGTARTYGKGIMQTHLPDPSGNTYVLTTATMYWPNGMCIHKRGVDAAMGANAVSAPLLAGAEDVFLRTVLEKLTETA